MFLPNNTDIYLTNIVGYTKISGRQAPRHRTGVLNSTPSTVFLYMIESICTAFFFFRFFVPNTTGCLAFLFRLPRARLLSPHTILPAESHIAVPLGRVVVLPWLDERLDEPIVL